MAVFSLLTVLITSPVSATNKEPIIIGLDADMTTVAVEGGTAIKRGAQIAINEINAQGGVLGRPLELLIKNHRGNPARGIANIKALAKVDNLVAVLGGVHTPVALKELPYIHEHNIIYLGPWAAGTPIVDNGYQPNYVFRLSVRDEHAGKVLTKRASNLGHQRIGLLLERTGWGRSNHKSMSASAEALGQDITAVEWFNWRDTDVSIQVENIINSGAEAILLVANAREGAVIIKEIASLESGKKRPIFSHWGLSGGSFVEQIGLENLKQVHLEVLQTYSFVEPKRPKKGKWLLEQYQNTFDTSTTAINIPAAVGVVHAYDLIHLLAMAIKQADSLDRAVIRDKLENIKQYSGVMKEFNPPFNKDKHDALIEEDYILTRYNPQGYLMPVF